MELIIIILVVFLAVAGYTIWNLLNKLEKLEDFISLQEERDIQLLSTLRDLDSKQMFEKDDEAKYSVRGCFGFCETYLLSC